MKEKLSVLSIGLLMGMGLYSCSSADEFIQESQEQVEIKLSSSVKSITRGVDPTEQNNYITAGQSIGVTITGAIQDHKNVEWQVTDANGSLSNTSGTPIYYGTKAATITAYHPYNGAWDNAFVNHTFTVQQDQSTTGYKNSDLLWVSKTQEKTGEAVNLEFRHLLSQVNVELKCTDGSITEEELNSATIKICNTNLNVDILLSTGALSQSGTADIQDITAAVNSKKGSAIIVPQTVISGYCLLKIILGESVYTYSLSASKEFLSGTSYKYNMKISRSGISLAGYSISDWTDTSSTVDGEETQALSGTVNGHEWVDLGLPSGTLWATCNIGAADIYKPGNYYAWGEIEPETNGYNWTNYKWCNGSYNTLTKYNTHSFLGTIDNIKTLESSDDAATANWGENWRMPTKEEFEELVANTSQTLYPWNNLYDGQNSGVLFVGSNGNSIFMPAGGFYNDKTRSSDSSLFYWSSNVYNSSDDNGFSLYCSLAADATARSDYFKLRSNGLLIRPVLK